MAISSRDGQSLIVIGGYNPGGILSDAWEFHLGRREWDRVNLSAGPSPPERAFFRGERRPSTLHLCVHKTHARDCPSSTFFGRLFSGFIFFLLEPSDCSVEAACCCLWSPHIRCPDTCVCTVPSLKSSSSEAAGTMVDVTLHPPLVRFLSRIEIP